MGTALRPAKTTEVKINFRDILIDQGHILEQLELDCFVKGFIADSDKGLSRPLFLLQKVQSSSNHEIYIEHMRVKTWDPVCFSALQKIFGVCAVNLEFIFHLARAGNLAGENTDPTGTSSKSWKTGVSVRTASPCRLKLARQVRGLRSGLSATGAPAKPMKPGQVVASPCLARRERRSCRTTRAPSAFILL